MADEMKQRFFSGYKEKGRIYEAEEASAEAE
jgi:hypothetical protein